MLSFSATAAYREVHARQRNVDFASNRVITQFIAACGFFDVSFWGVFFANFTVTVQLAETYSSLVVVQEMVT